MMRRRRGALARRYGHSAAHPSFVEEYIHDHAEIAGAAVGAGIGAVSGGVTGVIGAVVGGLVGAGVGLAARRSRRRKTLAPGRDTWPAPLRELRAAFEAGRLPRGQDKYDSELSACRVCRL